MQSTIMNACPVCGNDADQASQSCRFCGSEFEPRLESAPRPAILHRTVNLEQGRPLVETAMKRLELELGRARSENVRVVTLIHGYGSSGKGGTIKVECRKMLGYLVQQHRLNSCINGEDFDKRSGPGKALLRRFPGLEQSCGSDFNNPGISIAVL